MRHSQQIEKAPKAKVVVDETVPYTFRAYHGLKRHLQESEQTLKLEDEIVWGFETQTRDATEQIADGQKLFLHQSVSRYKPEQKQLDKWVSLLRKAPTLVLGNGCRITMIQPRTKRPGRTFYNPTKPRAKGRTYNDGLSYSAIVLLQQGRLPQSECDEASHICGHARCVNPDHLVWERSSINFARNECHHYDMICCHVPRCIPNSGLQMEQIKRQLAVAKARSTRKRHKKLGMK